MADAYTITRQREEVSFDSNNKITRQIVIEFKTETDGPFTLTFPKDGFSGFSARSAIDAFVRELTNVRGL